MNIIGREICPSFVYTPLCLSFLVTTDEALPHIIAFNYILGLYMKPYVPWME